VISLQTGERQFDPLAICTTILDRFLKILMKLRKWFLQLALSAIYFKKFKGRIRKSLKRVGKSISKNHLS